MKKIYNFAPVTVTFTLASIAVLVLSLITLGWTDRLLFSVYRSSWANPFAYLRVFLHVLGHANWAHWATNFGVFIIAIGVILERRYGSKAMFFMIALTAFITGVAHLLFAPPNYALLGASGIVFMLILLAACTFTRKLSWGRVPIVLILIAAIYFGREFVGMAAQAIGLGQGNISHTSHIIGGICGIIFGFTVQPLKSPK